MNRETRSWRDIARCAGTSLLLVFAWTHLATAQLPQEFLDAPAKIASKPLTEEAESFREQPRETSLLPTMIYSAACSPDEKWIAVGTSDWTRPGDVILFRRDALTENFSPRSRVVRRFATGVRDVAFSADSRYFAAAIFSNDVWVVDLSTMKTIAFWKPGKEAVNSVSFSPDSRWLATGSLDKTVCVWNLTPPEKESDGLPLHAKLEGHTESVFTTAFSPDNRTLLSAGRDKKVIVWDVEERKSLATWTELPDVVEHLAMSPNGESVALALWNGRVELRRRADGSILQQLPHLNGEGYAVTRVAFAPDSEQLASVATDGQVKLWSCQDGSLIRSWETDKDRCWAVQFTAAGQQIITGGADGVLKVWDRNAGKLLYELRDRVGLTETSVPMTAAAWAPDGSVFATAHRDNTLRVRRGFNGSPFGETRDLPEVLRCLSYSPFKQQVAAAGEGPQAYLIPVEPEPTLPVRGAEHVPRKPLPPIVLIGHTGQVRQIVYAADGQTVFTVSDDGTVRHWDAFTGLPGPVRNPKQGPLYAVGCTSDGRWLVAAGHAGKIFYWDLRTAGLQTAASFSGPGGAIFALGLSADGTQLAISSADKTVRLWTLPANADASTIARLEGTPPLVVVSSNQPVTLLRFSPLGTWLATDGPDRSLRLCKTAKGEPGLVVPVGDAPLDLAFVNQGLRISKIGDGRIQSWDGTYAKLKPIATMNLSDGVRFLAFTPDQTQAVIGTLTATVHVWDLQTGKITKGHCSEGIADGALSADGKTLATMGFSGDVALWSVSPPKIISTLKRGGPTKAGENEGTAIAVSADGTRLATGSWDGTIVVWDVAHRKELYRLPQQDLPIEGLRFSPNGRTLASATGNWKEWQKPGAIKLWDVDTGKETATLPGPRSKMRRVSFSRDGNTLIAGGSQHDLLVYTWTDGMWKPGPPFPTFGDNAVVEFVGDNADMILSGTSDGGVTLLETQSRAQREGVGHRTPKPELVAAAAVSNDGSLMATGSSAGEVHFYLTPGAAESGIGPQLAKRKIPGVVAPIHEKKSGG